MATIKTAINLYDGMSPVIRSMSNALNILVNSFEGMQAASARPIDTSSISNAESKIESVNDTINNIDRNVGNVNIDTSNVALARGDIGTVNNAVDSVERNIGNVNIDTSSIPTARNSIGTVNDTIDSIDKNVGNVIVDTSSVVSARNEVGTVNSAIDSIGNNVGYVNIDVAGLKAAMQELQNADVAYTELEEKIRKGKEQQEKFNQKIKAGNDIASKFKSILATIGVGIGIKETFNLSDELAQTTARLNMIVDKESDINALQEKIFASAQRSRASYADTADIVAKLSQRTGDLFNNDEAVLFAENMNKMYTIAGASQEEMRSASLQLTQAMGAGVLRGEEFNAIYEAAPNIIQNIADYIQKNEDVAKRMSDAIGVSYESMSTDAIRHMKTLASEGQITSDVIKNAMLGSTEEIDKQFQNMPYTWAQVWTTIQNVLLNAFQPLLQVIGSAADWIGSNWSTIEPIFWGIAAAVGVVAAAFGIWKLVTMIQTAAQWALNSALLANPITWIVLVIAAIVAAIVIWINKIGGLKVAWLTTVDAVLTAWDWVKIGFFTGVYWVIGLWEKMSLGMKSAGVGIANFMGDMKVNVLTIIQNMVNGAIDIINGFINKLNQLPGVSIDAIAKVTFATTAALENDATKQARNTDLETYRKEIEGNAAERDANLNKMKEDARTATAERQAKIDKVKQESVAKDKSNGMEDLLKGIEENAMGTADNTAKMADSMDALEDSLEYMVDIAEREAINRFTTAEITIEQTNNNNISSNMDIDGVMERWNADFTEILDTAAEGVHE